MQPLAAVLVRALGAYLVVTNANLFGMLLGTQLSMDSSRIAIQMAAPAAFTVLGIAMVIWSKSLGALLMSGLEAPTLNVSAPQLLQVGTALIALLLLAGAVSDAVGAAWDYFRQAISENDAVAEMRRQRMVTSIVRAGAGVVLGVIFLWMARGLFARKGEVVAAS